jgi:hypothetical protein
LQRGLHIREHLVRLRGFHFEAFDLLAAVGDLLAERLTLFFRLQLHRFNRFDLLL